MVKIFKRLFIPHVGNAYRPHFLMGHNLHRLLGLMIGLELLLFVVPTLHYAGFIENLNLSAVLPGALSTLTNEKRASSNLPQLTENEKLNLAAQLKAEDMAAKSYFAHTSPEGKTPWYWFTQVGYKYVYAGENLAVSFTDSNEVTEAWMNSPSHRANLIGRQYREIGTGAATGTYKGAKTVFVAQVYGSPLTLNLSAAASEAPLTPWLQALTSPHQSVNTILLSVLAITFAALFLNLFIKVDKHHPDLFINGSLLIVAIFGLYLFNNFLTRDDFETSFIAFEAPPAAETLSE